MTSPKRAVHSAAKVAGEMVWGRNRTLPSARATFTPPVWKLYGSLSLLQFMMQLPVPEGTLSLFTAPVVGLDPSMLPTTPSGLAQPVWSDSTVAVGLPRTQLSG